MSESRRGEYAAGRQRFATRLVLALAGAGLAILAFGGVVYVEVIVPIEDAAVRSSVLSGFVGLLLTAAISLALVGVTVGSNTAITLRLLSSKARQMEEGNMDVDLETDRDDEIGVLAESLASMRDSLEDRIAEVERQRAETEALNEHMQMKAEHYETTLRQVTEGDLSQRVDTTSEVDAIASIGESINLTVGGLEEITETIARQMENLSATSEEVAASADEVVQTTEEAARAGRVGRQAAESALEEMATVETDTDDAVAEIDALQDEMAEITEIVQLITEIAQKTNILAVNARIESSRSADAGQGYSVVADEIRDLAEETKTAAQEVEERIQRVQRRTESAAGDVTDASERVSSVSTTVTEAAEELATVADYADDVDANVKNISEATDQQARAVDEVATMVEDLAAMREADDDEFAAASEFEFELTSESPRNARTTQD